MDASRPGGDRAPLRVGAFVLASLLVFTGLVYMLGRSAGLFERQYRLVASFGQIGGLIQGATVRLAGVPVGRVGATACPSRSAKVRVELLIARRVQDRIRADSLARIETLGLLGDKIIDVTLGSPGATILQDGGELRSEEPFDTARLTQQGAALLGNLVRFRDSDGPLGHHRELHGAPGRRDRAGAPQSRDRDRARAGRPPPARRPPEARDGAREWARRSGSWAKPCGGSTACSPIREPPGWPVRRSGRLRRRGAPPNASTGSFGRSKRARGPSTRSSTTRGAC